MGVTLVPVRVFSEKVGFDQLKMAFVITRQMRVITNALSPSESADFCL
ncbi:succinyl-CoA synthetase subunit beta [Sulfitobacter indolifex HEL-45]|uniref:Succinyl-CoA synthetase subunit beta n=1 Tax=Sulfitobacter indolifex HEL-45 TaxID=391624 RepID=A0ABP2DDD6_9RHOB|nr:succinyl-CoA synthetase subunit beta [Sulfitobacter indolifex HEL-45]